MADTAQLTLLQVGNGEAEAAEKFTTLAGVTGISGPGISNPTVDATTLSDTARQKISSELVDSGQVTLDLLFDAVMTGDQNALVDKVVAGAVASNYQLCFSNLLDEPVGITVAYTVDQPDDQLDLSEDPHGIRTGQPLIVAATVTMPTGLVAGTTYYAIYVDTDSIQVAATNALAVTGTQIDLTGAGAGDLNLTYGTCYRFSALCSDCQITSAVGEVLTATLTLDVDGTITIFNG